MTDNLQPQKENALLPHITIDALHEIQQTARQTLSQIPTELVAKTTSTWQEKISPTKQKSSTPPAINYEQLLNKLEQTLQKKRIDSSLLNKTLQEILQLEKIDEKAANDRQEAFLDFAPKPNPAQENLNQLFKFPQLFPNYRTHFNADSTEQNIEKDNDKEEIFFDVSPQQTYPDIRTIILQERERRASEAARLENEEKIDDIEETLENPVPQEDLSLNHNSNEEHAERVTVEPSISSEEVIEIEQTALQEQKSFPLERRLGSEHPNSEIKHFSASEYVQTESFTSSYKVNTAISWQEFKSQYDNFPNASGEPEETVDVATQLPLTPLTTENISNHSDKDAAPDNGQDISTLQDGLNNTQKTESERGKTIREEPQITLPVLARHDGGLVSTDSIHTHPEKSSQEEEKRQEGFFFGFTKYLRSKQSVTETKSLPQKSP